MRLAALLSVVVALPVAAQAPSNLLADIERRVPTVTDSVVAWRRDIHQHPELSYQETRTAALVAAHLKALGLEVQTGVGGNGLPEAQAGAVSAKRDPRTVPVSWDP